MVTVRLRTHLLAMLFAILLPGIVFSALMVVKVGRLERSAVERGYRDTTRALSLAVDRELLGTITTLQALAESDHLDRGDLEAFRRHAERVIHTQPGWTNVIVFDRAGVPAVNVPRAMPATPGTAGAPIAPDTFARAVRTLQPAVSNLVIDRETSAARLIVCVPIIRRDRVVYVLAARIDPARFSDILVAQHLPPGLIGGLNDREHTIIARSRLPEQFVGRRATAKIAAESNAADEGWFENIGLEGRPIYTAFQRSALSGWTVVLSAPAEVVESGLRWSLWTAAAGGAMLLVLATGIGVVFARRLSRPLRAATAAADAVGRGESPPPLAPARIEELAALGRSLTDAERLLAERAAARDRAETELAATLARERAARTEAEALNRAKDEFLAMLGHELRNPLGAIRTAVHVLEAAGTQEEQTRRARDVVRRQVVHLAALVDDLVDAARVTFGKIRLARRPLDLAEAVRRCVSTMAGTGRTDRHRLELATEPVWIHADQTRIDQILTNLVDNAVKYTPVGGVIRIRLTADADAAVLEVADTGVGIPAATLPHVFDLFVQGESTLDRAKGGLGIGLTLVRRLVELHGGTVHADSAGCGRGSTFTVRLPRISAPTGRAPGVSAAEEAPAVRRVLVVEDNDDAREMLCAALTLAGHHVVAAADGRAALAMVAAARPDVALIDIGLPELDGYAVARGIRAGPAGESVLLVAVTGYGQMEDRLRSQEAGFDAHLSKPVAPERLAAIIAGGETRPGARL